MIATRRPIRAQRGLSFAELLVVLAIIAVITAIAVPTVTNHTERARIAGAQADCRAMAQAEDACAALHGFYVPLQLLDDLPGDTVSNSDADRIGLEGASGIVAIDPLIPPLDQQGNQQTITQANGGRIREMIVSWQGPFIDFRRATNTPNPPNQSDQRNDFPLDPYGQPYRFFSPIGEIGSIGANPIDDPENLTGTNDGDGVLTSNNDEFDRYAVVSFGRDATLDTALTLQEGDDIVHLFGIVGYETGTLSRFPF